MNAYVVPISCQLSQSYAPTAKTCGLFIKMSSSVELQPAPSLFKSKVRKDFGFKVLYAAQGDTYDRLRADLELMDSLGFHFAGKVVRGAYMEMERSRAAKMGYDDPIHDSYEDTCSMYNNVINTLLQRVQHTPAQVMIASHNEESVAMAIQRMRELDIHPKEHGVSFGQVYGMCDQVTYVLGEQGYNVYKSVPYGPVDSVMAYLGRRANENRDVLKRTEKERSLYQQELKRRMGLLW